MGGRVKGGLLKDGRCWSVFESLHKLVEERKCLRMDVGERG